MYMDSQLFALRRDFFSLVPSNKLQFPGNVSLSRLNDFFLNDMLLYSHFQKYSPSQQYQISFWKWAVQHLEELTYHISEEEEGEIASPIYEHYVGLISLSCKTTPGTVVPSPSYVTYFWSPSELEGMEVEKERVNVHEYLTVTLLESRTMIERGTTGLRTWLASLYLAQYLIKNPEFVLSKCVLELGSGIGFLGIIVASLQQMGGRNQSGALWLTDINHEVLDRCRGNLTLPCNLSSSHPAVNFMKLDWCSSLVNTESSSMVKSIEDTIHPDLVIGADIVFDPSLIPGLVSTIKMSLERHASCALIAVTIRNKSTLSCFMSNLQEYSLDAEELALPVAQSFSHHDIDAGAQGNIIIFQITRIPTKLDL